MDSLLHDGPMVQMILARRAPAEAAAPFDELGFAAPFLLFKGAPLEFSV
jgi:hypothetical protein